MSSPDEHPQPQAGAGARGDPGRAVDSPDFARLHIWQVQAFRDVLVVAAVVGVVWAGYALRFVTVPLLLAFALAYLVEPLVRWLSRSFRLSRTAAVGLIMSTVGVGIVLAGIFLTLTVVGQASQFLGLVRSGQFDPLVAEVSASLPTEWQTKLQGWVAMLGSPSSVVGTPVATERPAGIATLLGSTTQDALSGVVGVSSLLFAALLIPFYFWFFSIGFPGALQFIGGLIPEARKARILSLASEMDVAIAGFVRGRILIAAGMGGMFAIGWYALGVPFAVSLGLLGGLLSIVPYLGIVAVIPATAMLAMAQLHIPEDGRLVWYMTALGPAGVYVIVQSIEGYILTPVFAGKATNLGPVSIFVAVLAGASVAGVYGMLLAIPVAACAKILARETLMPSLRAWAQGKSSDPLPL